MGTHVNPFAENPIVRTVDSLALRYGRLPTEILQMDLDEFQLNVAIINSAKVEPPPEVGNSGTTSVADEIRRRREQWQRDAQMYG